MFATDGWLSRMAEDMRLRDLRPRTRDSYMRAARFFFEYTSVAPEKVTNEHIRRYFIHLRDERKLAPSSVSVAIHGVRFFFVHTMQQQWPVFDLLQAKVPRKLPVVLNREEVHRLLAAVRSPVHRTALTTIYALGLRLGEALRLRSEHIDGQRLMVLIRDGKGGRDRAVPLPLPLLVRLRSYWKHHRPASSSPLLFVAQRSGLELHPTMLQRTVLIARRELHFEKQPSVHSLRHSYATHLLERGISIKTVQGLLGHKSVRTTEIYAHLTPPAAEHLQRVLDQLMAGI